MFLERKSRNQSDIQSENLFFRDPFFLRSRFRSGRLQVLNEFKVDQTARQVGQP